jgi:hypothetical protein
VFRNVLDQFSFIHKDPLFGSSVYRIVSSNFVSSPDSVFGSLHGAQAGLKLVWITLFAATKNRSRLEPTGLWHVNTPCSITTVRSQILAAFLRAFRQRKCR